MSEIPTEIIAFLAKNLPDFNSHTELDTIFLSVGISDSIPNESKEKKIQRRLLSINNNDPNPIQKLEILLNKAIEPSRKNEVLYGYDEQKEKFQKDVERELNQHGFTYIKGKVLSSQLLSPATITLSELIEKKDVESINREFYRALESLNTNSLDAISSACNILESILKVYISEKSLTLPSTQTLRELWKVIKNDFEFGLDKLEKDDLQKINAGITSIIDGIASIRTHASSAHGQGQEFDIPEVRHARFVVNAAHSLAVFILESW